jgi:adenylate cyclase
MILGRYRDALSAFAHIPVRQYHDFALVAACHAQLGDMQNARACVASCLSLRPHFSIQRYMSKEPFRMPADANHVSRSLRAAGLPD